MHCFGGSTEVAHRLGTDAVLANSDGDGIVTRRVQAFGGGSVRFATLTLAVAILGCRAPTSAWIAWQPRDPSAVEAMGEALESYGMGDEVEKQITFDPLSVVPDDQFRSAFPQLKRTDTRMHHCQLGSTGSNVATIEFTPHALSDTAVRRNVFHCRHDPTRRVSYCEFDPDVAYHRGDSEQALHISKEIEPADGIALMRLLATGAFRSEIPGFPPTDWPDQWWSKHSGRFLGPAEFEPGPHRFELSFAGCGCYQNLVLEYGSRRASSEVLIVGEFMLCI